MKRVPTRPIITRGILGLLFGCGGSEPPVPSAIVVTPPSVTFTAIGQTQQLSATVEDEQGATLEGAQVSWNSSNAAVATVSQDGAATAVGIGSAEITATAGAANAAVSVTVTQTPAQIQKVSGDGQTGPAGQSLPLPLMVEVRDALGNLVAGTVVTFEVTQGGGEVASPSVTTGADGRASTAYTLGTAAGPGHQVTASSQASSVSAIFLETALAGAPAAVATQSGDGQTALPGNQVPTPPTVRVSDLFGNPVSGVSVTFEVGVGGGSVTGAAQTTDAGGLARVGSWTLGASGTNTLIATVAEDGISGNPVIFIATGSASIAFNIEVRLSGSPTPAQREAFADAEERWESLVTGDLPDLDLAAAAGDCGESSPEIDETIDDVVILASVEAIDGPGAILAQAGPCYIRRPGALTILGLMRFDEDDLESIEADGLLPDVILHEMGHVLGFGTIWSDPEIDLLAESAADGGIDPHFTGAQAIAAFDAAGGTTYTGGAKVPVEDAGGAGTQDSHWRESVFDSELMTGFVNLGQNPLSRVTVASLNDMGYSVNLSGADSYSLAPGLRMLGSGRRLALGNDIFMGPVRVVDRQGRVTGLLRR